jgi:hypothetical protein
MPIVAGLGIACALTRAMNTHPPQPGDDSDVPTFQRDLVDYQWSMHRAMLLGVAGAGLDASRPGCRCRWCPCREARPGR